MNKRDVLIVNLKVLNIYVNVQEFCQVKRYEEF